MEPGATLYDVLLKQYELFSARKLHFGRLFWSVLGIFTAICLALANLIEARKASAFPLGLMVMGCFTIAISYVGHRLRQNEDSYERILRQIENSLSERYGPHIVLAPFSRQFGARTIVVLLFLIAGIGMIGGGVFQWLRH
jgi:hypothetical protein